MWKDETIIVGHAPSLMGAGNGSFIDSFRYVIRFPFYGYWQTPQDHGVRISYWCLTENTAKVKLRPELPDDGYFILAKQSEGVDAHAASLIEKFGGEDITGLIHYWRGKLPKNAKYRGYGFDIGTCGICAALAVIGKPVTVIGCDFLRDGRTDRYNMVDAKSIEGRYRNKAHKKRAIARHPFKESRVLIDDMVREYGVSVRWI